MSDEQGLGYHESQAIPATGDVVVEQQFGKYRMADHAIDMESWVRDGHDALYLLGMFHGLCVEMLHEHGGEFRYSSKKHRAERRIHRLGIRYEETGTPGQGDYDYTTIATLTDGDSEPSTEVALEEAREQVRELEHQLAMARMRVETPR